MFNYMSEHLLVLDDLEDALGCLEHLEVLSQDLTAESLDEGEVQGKSKGKSKAKSANPPLKIVLQWPEGKALKVSKIGRASCRERV